MTTTSDRYQRVFENLTIPVILLDGDYRVESLNRPAAELFSNGPGAEPSFPSAAEPGTDLPWLREELALFASRNLPEQIVEKSVETRRGSRYFQVTLKRLQDGRCPTCGTMVMLADLTEQKQAEEALRESELKFRTVVQSADDAIVLSDGHGTILSWNQGAQAMFGYEESEVLGQPLTMLFPDPYRQASPDLLEWNPLTGGFRKNDKTAESYGVRKDGSRFPVELSVAVWEMGSETFYSGIIRDISERKRAEALLRLLSLTDELTGLYNRRGFLMLAEQQLRMAARTKHRMYLVFVDLDGMKWINDTLGHQEGDRAIREAAALLKHTYRESDIIARIGGDEFAVLVSEGRKDDAAVLTVRLEKNLAQRQAKPDQSFTLSLSIGIVTCDAENPCSLDTLLDQADREMYEQKQRKKAGNPVPLNPGEE